jgi:hypothetical protein
LIRGRLVLGGSQRYTPAVARETRKLQRAQRQDDGKSKVDLSKPLAIKPGEMPDPLGSGQLKSMLFRLAIPVVGAWVVLGLAAAVVSSTTVKAILIAIPAIVTILAAVLVVWALRQAKKARGVASIMSNVETAEDRKQALAQLDASFKKNDPAAVFAKAQLELQEDPRKALTTLEQIDLNKVLGTIADEARTQRALIHLTLGEVSLARQLVDNVDLKRHQDPKSRAMMAAVAAEAWARSGDAKRGLETLGLFDPEEATYDQLRPQLYRAYAYAYAHASDIKGVRRVLKRLLAQDVRLLGGFMVKKTHPLLQKEAKKMLEQSGQVPRKMMIQRKI